MTNETTNIVRITTIVNGEAVIREEDLGFCDDTDCGAPLEIHCTTCNAVYCEACEYGI